MESAVRRLDPSANQQLKMLDFPASSPILMKNSKTAGALFLFVGLISLVFGLTGCSSPDYQPPDLSSHASDKSEPVILREGDVLKVTFPGAPNLNATQQIRRDGKITLALVGDVSAAGKTRIELESDLKELYKPQLVTKEVTVTVESSSFDVYITGAVLRPGKVISSRPLTALEAVMEAGGPDYTRANLKSVKITRNNKDRMEHYTLNLKEALEGKSNEPFYLKPSDIVYVPEKFQWL
jgi:polysaccharide biosynthesis/export protein